MLYVNLLKRRTPLFSCATPARDMTALAVIVIQSYAANVEGVLQALPGLNILGNRLFQLRVTN